ncbi:MAG: hypothetical protein ABI741_12580 [Ferruginibacter sp.]
MRQFTVLILFIFFILPQKLAAQEIVYSDFNNEDNRDINFEILGKMNGSYIIYKNIRWKHMLAIYDNNMRIIKNVRLKFIPDKTFNIDFITYTDHFYMIYQFQRNNVVYCKAVKMDADGKKLSEPIDLDTTRISILADNKIYNTIYSQDKQKILIYKIPRKNSQITIATKLFDASLNMLDSTRHVAPYDDRKDFYSDLFVDNEGNFIYTKGTKGVFRTNIAALEVICRRPGEKDSKTLGIDLKETYMDESIFKIDNLNKHYILNSFFYTHDPGNIKGLFTIVIDAVKMDTIRSAFNVFPDSLRAKVNSDGLYKAAFDNFFIRQAIVKKDGGFILTTEDYSSQTRSNPNNSWNRSNYLYNSPYSSNDYYLSNPAYGYYRPLSSFNNWQDVRFYYDNILILSLDGNLNIQWNTIIPKTQSDDEVDNFLSFSTMNVGAEIHFLYNEGERKQIISNQSILPNGELKRYPTLKSREAGYEFMPRLAKQVGYREVIIPCVYRTNIAFAKVNFSE